MSVAIIDHNCIDLMLTKLWSSIVSCCGLPWPIVSAPPRGANTKWSLPGPPIETEMPLLAVIAPAGRSDHGIRWRGIEYLKVAAVLHEFEVTGRIVVCVVSGKIQRVGQ